VSTVEDSLEGEEKLPNIVVRKNINALIATRKICGKETTQVIEFVERGTQVEVRN
jgi:hypothetical protein